MAISHTMSNPNNWQFQPYDDYQSNVSNINNQNDQFSSTTTTTNVEGSSSTSMLRNNNNNNNTNSLSPDQGRVSKPVRRRSRASRKTPTTILSTDTTNFRAMVQQFTGSPAIPFVTVQQPQPFLYGANLNFTRDFTNVNNIAPASGFHVQYPNQDNMSSSYMIDHNNITRGGGVRGQSGGGEDGRGAFTSGFTSNNKKDDHDDRML